MRLAPAWHDARVNPPDDEARPTAPAPGTADTPAAPTGAEPARADAPLPAGADAPRPAPPAGGTEALARAGDADGDAADPGEDASGLDDRVAAWVGRALEAYPRPVHPLAREWDVSVQGLVRLVPLLPRFATAPLALLDRFGAVTVGPERVGLDGTDVEWSRVVEVRTEPAWTCLSAAAFEADLTRFVTFVPPVPGRAWLLRRVSELLMSLYLAVLPAEDGDGDLLADDAFEHGGLLDHVVTGITYTRRFGQGEASVSVPSALLQLVLPGTADAIVRTARDHGVVVTHVPAQETSVGTVITRGETWRRTALGLRDDLADRWRRR